ncbi:MAG: VWA domain-containing protein [Holophagales bacterium]|nr:VWA domain-containing protein [Holophagales bacterium]MXX61683.1 VWA domain-containing protein [Holophagales bacterium]MYC09671.1 VWA domain-containing protein [Holophagales bacterium]MYD22656.1 VWA domain-containing protein [Holophagales bacterium]MYI31621.1 VWA domain-containing protein [Holophagales bacterium]
MTDSALHCRPPTLLVATAAMALTAASHFAGPEAARAQDGSPRQHPIREDIVLRESIDVRLISLDAVVTDSSDRPVTGLTKDDFELKVENEPVEILSVAAGQDLRTTVTGRLTILLFIDERHLQRKHRDAALAEIAKALDQEVAANPTWVAAAAFGERLEPLLSPTRDRAAVRTTIEAAMDRNIPTTTLRSQQRSASLAMRETLRLMAARGSRYRLGEASLASVEANLRSFGQALRQDTLLTVSAVRSLVEALAFVPGRKAILFVSDGLPRHPLDSAAKTMYDRLAGSSRQLEGDEMISAPGSLDLNDRNHRPFGVDRADRMGRATNIVQVDDGGAFAFQTMAAELSCADAFDQLAALANTHRVTFYPLKPPVIDPAISELGESAKDRGSIVELSNVRTGLNSLAGLTGGLSFVSDTGVAEFLQSTRTDISTYYSLSFTPPDSMGDSGIREITLRLRQRPLARNGSLRYRASYAPVTIQQNLASRAWGTLLFGWEENNHGMEVQVRRSASRERPDRPGQTPLEVRASLPIGDLELAPTRATRNPVASGFFRVVVQVQREDGSRMPPQHFDFELNVPVDELEQAAGQYIAVRSEVLLAPGSYRLAVGIWEENSGRSSFVVRELAVQADPSVA